MYKSVIFLDRYYYFFFFLLIVDRIERSIDVYEGSVHIYKRRSINCNLSKGICIINISRVRNFSASKVNSFKNTLPSLEDRLQLRLSNLLRGKKSIIGRWLRGVDSRT